MSAGRILLSCPGDSSVPGAYLWAATNDDPLGTWGDWLNVNY